MKSQEITSEAQRALAFLVRNKDFSGPELYDRNCMTELRYCGQGYGIELELDWRERDAFILIVRLTDTEWPSEYYVEDGRKCRIHLEQAIKMQGWLSTASTKGNPAGHSDNRMISEIRRKARLLEEVVDHIALDLNSLFV